MTRQILDMDAFLESLTDSVQLEEELAERDPGGRMTHRFSDIGVFFPFDCDIPKTAIWLPSEELWEEQSIASMEREKIERTKQFGNQEPEEFGNGARKTVSLSRG